jgi:hypothetical protein
MSSSSSSQLNKSFLVAPNGTTGDLDGQTEASMIDTIVIVIKLLFRVYKAWKKKAP